MDVFTICRTRLLWFVSATMTLFFLSCKDDGEKALQAVHDPSKPIVLTDFSPAEGGAKDKILLNGENFGSDPSKIEVYFNNRKAAVVNSGGNRIYALVPRLPGDEPKIKVKIGDQEAVYGDAFVYHEQAVVSTVVGNGTREFRAGTLDDAQVGCKYLELDAEGNLFFTWRDGSSGNAARYGVGRLNEKNNVVVALYNAASSPYPYANGVTVDRSTGVATVSHESITEVFFSFDPKEAWIPRQRNATFAIPHDIPNGDQYMNFISFCPYDGYLYTRARMGHIVKINPDTYQATVVHAGSKDSGSKWPYGSQYGQGINPARPWELWMTLHTNASPVEYRQGLMVLDLRPEYINEGFKRVNAPGGSDHRDGPIADAVFSSPKDIKFDNDGNMFVADYGNHCIRMVSADGIVTTVAGQPKKSGYKDGGPIESLFNAPWGVAVNEQGDIYIADFGNNRIRKLVIE